MTLRYTDKDLRPQSTDTFYAARDTGAGGFNVTDLVDQNAVAAIGETFETASLAEQGWEYAQPQGRIDTRRAWRFAAFGDTDVFKYRNSASPSTVRVIVLVDASGSMRGGGQPIRKPDGTLARVSRREASAVLAAMLVEGLDPIPTVKIEVLQHDFGYTTANGEPMRRRSQYRHLVHTVNIRRAWDEGTPVEFMNNMPAWSPGGGNADGHALMAVGEYLKEDLLPGEVPMIIIVSDGAPADMGKNADYIAINAKHGEDVTMRIGAPGAAIREAVATLREDGVEVVSVAIDGGDQTEFYGEERCVTFNGDWIDLANALTAKVAERVAAGAEEIDSDAFNEF